MWTDYVLDKVVDHASAVVRMRNYESSLMLFHWFADALLVLASLGFAFWITGTAWSLPLVWTGLIGAVLFCSLGGTKHLYRSWRTERIPAEAWLVIETWIGVAGVLLAAIYIQQDAVSYPPGVILAWFAIAPFVLIGWRLVVRLFLRRARAKGHNTRSLAIAGSGDLARQVARTAAGKPWMGFKIVGLFDDVDENDPDRRAVEKPQQSLDDLVALARNGEVDTIYIALPAGRSERQCEDLVRRLGNSTASVYLVQDRRSRTSSGKVGSSQVLPDLRRIDLLHRTYVDLAGIKAVSVYESPFLGAEAWLKRFEDIVISSIALTLLALPMLAIAIGVKMSGPGPVFFKQRRYGQDGKEIMVWKFRSMTVCEDGDKVDQAQKGDARITKFGGFLRRTSLDELPQFFNVFGGTMSIVGPRPHAVAHNERYRELIAGYMLRHKVKPGITGWAQINGWRGETESIDKMGRRIDYDLDYIRNWSLWLDIRIIFLTAFKGFVHSNAY
jgi:putative colanic acid biosysnthesis UDP-glucose lipid carrier transferase